MIPSDRYQSIGELLRDALIQFKTEPALIEANRRKELRRLTYLEVKRHGEKIARRLQDLGVREGDRVAIIMSNQSKWIVNAYATFFCGAVLVPIDYKLTGKEQAALLKHCKAKVLFIEHPLFALLPEWPVPNVFVTEAPEGAPLASASRWEDHPATTAAPDFVPRKRDDVATIVYSSGTGGRPKGCMLTHDNYLEQYRTLTALFPLEQGDRYFSILPTNHAIDFMCGFLGPLAGGAAVVHQRTLRPEFINDSLRRFKITHMAVVPLILEAFEERVKDQLEERPEPVQHGFDLLKKLNASLTAKAPKPHLSRTLLKPVHDAFGGHLKLLFCGGAFVDRDRAEFFYELGIPVVIGYGLTEAGTVLTVNDLKPFRPDSVGRPLDGVELEIRDPNPQSGVGEVWVRSRTVMKGYLDDPKQTAEVLQDGWLRTGDLGWVDASGHLHLVGRSKNMIVTAGGKNIYPEDIENAFEDLACEELVVFASNYVWPGGALTDEQLIAVVRGLEDHEAAEAIRERNRKLPDFKRIDGFVDWQRPFPRTASMKIKRSVLADELRDELGRDAVRRVSP